MDAIFGLIKEFFTPILDMGGPVIMLIILTVLALLFGVKFSKALEGGIKLAIALTGIGAIIGMLNGAFLQHRTPTGHRLLHTQAQEAQEGFKHNHARHQQ